jgi:hypothetical protein
MSHRKDTFNSRAYQAQLERELVVGGLLIGLIVGIGLIYLLWGQQAAATSFACFVLFLGVIALVWGSLSLLTWLGNRG